MNRLSTVGDLASSGHQLLLRWLGGPIRRLVHRSLAERITNLHAGIHGTGPGQRARPSTSEPVRPFLHGPAVPVRQTSVKGTHVSSQHPFEGCLRQGHELRSPEFPDIRCHIQSSLHTRRRESRLDRDGPSSPLHSLSAKPPAQLRSCTWSPLCSLFDLTHTGHSLSGILRTSVKTACRRCPGSANHRA